MKRARIGITAAAILAVASLAFAQKPDFSGTWTLDEQASGMAAPAGGGAPVVVAVAAAGSAAARLVTAGPSSRAPTR